METGTLANRWRHRLVPEQVPSGQGAMHLQPNMPAQATRGASACEFCARPWFGSVAYCPYCGCRPGFLTVNQDRNDLLPTDAALAAGPGTKKMPAGELHREDPEPRETPRQGVPQPGEIPQVERIGPTTPHRGKKASSLLFRTVVAGISAMLVFWIGVKLFAPKTEEAAVSRPPASTSGKVSPGPVPSTSAAPVPSGPPRTGKEVPPPSTNRSLCSAASEKAGLCKSPV